MSQIRTNFNNNNDPQFQIMKQRSNRDLHFGRPSEYLCVICTAIVHETFRLISLNYAQIGFYIDVVSCSIFIQKYSKYS